MRNIKKGSIYHIVGRGSQKNLIFQDYKDYLTFLRKVSSVSKETNDKILAYCLMPNHYHFLIEADSPKSIPKLMHRVLTSHAIRFCKRYYEVGAIFQGRYRSKHVDTLNYLLYVIRYIHRNPLDLPTSLGDLAYYPWSSYGDYLGIRGKSLIKLHKKTILDVHDTLELMQELVALEDKAARERIRRLYLGSDPVKIPHGCRNI